MKTNPLLLWMAVVSLGLIRTEARGEDATVVKQNHVNVRGQPSLVGEVITQLQKGEKVVVLEEIPVEKPKKGEPARWARIQMPANTPVWVFASYIDPNNKSVAVNRVNLRAGPGEKFSVVGRLERGDTVKEIRKVDDWMEIETPDKAHAFIAMEFLSKSETNATPVLAKSEKIEPAPEPLKTQPQRTSPPAETAKTENTPPATQAQSAAEKPLPPLDKPLTAPTQELPANPTTPPEKAPAVANVASTAPAAAPASPPQYTTTTPLPVVSPSDTTAKPPAESGPAPKRIVRREGMVRSTKSIQAPTYFDLVNPDTRKVVNFLHTLDPELKFKDYKGRRIVVTGEEGIDPRWPTTPILEVETIELAP